MGKFVVSGTGNLTKDAVLRDIVSQDGRKSVGVEISVAANNSVFKNGEWKDEPVFVNVKYIATVEAKTPAKLLKGTTVSFYGVLTRETWTGQDGSEKARDVVKADHVEIISAKKETGSTETASEQKPAAQPAQKPAAQPAPEKEISEDEIPF